MILLIVGSLINNLAHNKRYHVTLPVNVETTRQARTNRTNILDDVNLYNDKRETLVKCLCQFPGTQYNGRSYYNKFEMGFREGQCTLHKISL